MNELITFIRRLALGLIALAAGLFVFLLALVVGVAFLIVTLLRGRRPSWQNVQFRRFGGEWTGGQRKAPAQSSADVVDVEVREVKDPSGPQDNHQRLDDSSSRISP